MRTRSSVLIVGVALVAGLLSACEPPPPRVQWVVDTTAEGADDDPGDGECRSSAALGGCTLRAAIEEGNTSATGADVVVPNEGQFFFGSAVVTGDIALDLPAAASIEGTITVAAGGLLQIEASDNWRGLSSYIEVQPGGTLTIRGANTAVNSDDTSGLRVKNLGTSVISGTWVRELYVGSGATTVVGTSVVGGLSAAFGAPAYSHGTLIVAGSSILGDMDATSSVPALQTNAGGLTTLQGTVVAGPETYVFGEPFLPGHASGCSGEPPESWGYVHLEIPCGGAPGVGDGSGPAGTYVEPLIGGTAHDPILYGYRHGLASDSPLIDAIPPGAPGCEAGTVDFYGNPRGVDGDGDGVGGCDIGAVEHQP
jgi:hypothetical protein